VESEEMIRVRISVSVCVTLIERQKEKMFFFTKSQICQKDGQKQGFLFCATKAQIWLGVVVFV
jgi:hypothetical protein